MSLQLKLWTSPLHWKHLAAGLAVVLWWALRRIPVNWWEQIIITSVSGILRGAIKNPAKFSGVEHIIVAIRNDATQVVDAIDPTAPPPPGYIKQP